MKKYIEIVDRLKSDTIKISDLEWLLPLAAEAIEVLSATVDAQDRRIMELEWESRSHLVNVEKDTPSDGEIVLAYMAGAEHPVIVQYRGGNSNQPWRSYIDGWPIIGGKVEYWMPVPCRKERS